MTDIKQVSDWALTIAAEAAGSKLHHYERMADDNRLAQSIEAHARAIEQHEAFRQEVSDAVEKMANAVYSDSSLIVRSQMKRFIIAKPDPLVDAVQDWWDADGYNDVANLRAAIEKRGGKIVWGEG